MSQVPGFSGMDPGVLRATDADPSAMSGLLRTTAELRDAAASLLNRRKPAATGTSAASQQQSLVVAGNKPAHLVDLDGLNKGLLPLEAYKKSISAFPSQLQAQQSRKGLHETIVSDVLDLSLRNLRVEAENRVGKALDADWECLKSRVLQEFKETSKPISTSNTGPAPSGGAAAPPMTPGPLSEPAGVMVTRREETPKMRRYFEEMKRFKEGDLNVDKSYSNLCDRFRQAVAEVGSNADACELWGLVKELVNAKKLTEKYRGVGSREFQRALAARQFLEIQYRDKLYGTMHGNVAGSEMQKKGFTPYQKLYELCRCGFWEVASTQATQMGDVELGDVLNKCARMSIGQAYTVDATADVYQLALSELMSGNGHPQVVKTAEDFIWVRLCKVTLKDDSSLAVLKSLDSLVEEVSSLGAQHFDETLSNPFMFARILASCTGLEQAIDYLARGFVPLATSAQVSSAVADPLPDAAHLAIVLSHIGVLEVPPNPDSSSVSGEATGQLLTADKGKQLLLSQLLALYASRFSDPIKAMFYATCLPRGAPVDDRAAKRILTGPLPLGGPLPLLKVLKHNLGDDAGATSRMGPSARIVLAAAKESRPADGISIYYEALKDQDLFKDQKDRLAKEAFQLLSKELASVMGLEASNKDRVFWRAEADRFDKLVDMSPESKSLFSKVLECVKFYDGYLKGDENAPAALFKWLLPESSDPSAVMRCAEAFFHLEPVLLDAFPRIISAVVECHMAAFSKGKQEEAKIRMAGLMAFIATLKDEGYRLRSDVEREMNVCDSRIRA